MRDEFTHYRGLPVFVPLEEAPEPEGSYRRREEWAPLCSTRAEPRRGKVTTERYQVTCNECRKILRLRIDRTVR